ncbi:thiol:disulfide interchange protein DsbA/DsbL [Alkalimonas delamerensis]|uniref:Thiol:disulfide interchange protein n=1 Tax=Alkalimonas delamerensis TaxID=265981 RepID=A0ABT9GSS2_9GAMM|nr:thiol:disulfide interchange protein DsbA/DsbL [Alkalimonas delamerensis]MDP4530024.1 thiol:disulfide interchange protein DsbA/DsbL [Alkalimonas delamerensis]
MMKKLFALLFSAAILAAPAFAQTFIEGKHYEVIAEQATSKPEFKEYFSFFCGGCASIEPLVQQISANLPEEAQFKKVHVDFVRGASPEVQNTLARAYLVADALDRGDAFSTAVFNHIHRQRQQIRNDRDVRSIALGVGISAEEYDNRINSFSVRMGATVMRNEQNELSRSRVLTGVPTFVVNGKYKINNNNLDSRNFATELEQLVNYLLQKSS